jgi:hypothetical protein
MFDSELSIEGCDPPTVWALTRPLVWTGERDTFTVPVGFKTDFATVPRFLHWLVLPYGAYTRAAVLHDYLLGELARWDRGNGHVIGIGVDDPAPSKPPATSRDIDGIFRRAMRDLGVPWSKRWVMWAAVRLASLFSARRAYGREFHKDALKVLAISELVGWAVVPGVIGTLISLGFIRLWTALSGGAPAIRARRGRLAGTNPKGT